MSGKITGQWLPAAATGTATKADQPTTPRATPKTPGTVDGPDICAGLQLHRTSLIRSGDANWAGRQARSSSVGSWHTLDPHATRHRSSPDGFWEPSRACFEGKEGQLSHGTVAKAQKPSKTRKQTSLSPGELEPATSGQNSSSRGEWVDYRYRSCGWQTSALVLPSTVDCRTIRTSSPAAVAASGGGGLPSYLCAPYVNPRSLCSTSIEHNVDE